MGKVTVQQSYPIEVGKWLRAHSYGSATCVGRSEPPTGSENSIGILGGVAKLERTPRLGILRRKPDRRSFLGVIWFSSDLRGASYKNWVFEVHGETHMAWAEELAKELADKFDVNIRVRLQTEEEKLERFSGEGAE